MAIRDRKTFYITTPIYYPNAKLHMGHAYTTTVSDVLARYHRSMGDNVHFLTGSDENTQKMVDSAERAGKNALEFLQEIVRNFEELYRKLDISYDQFIRTTDQELHWPGAQLLWSKLMASDDIYKKIYEGLYCVGHEAFMTKKDLVDGKCPDHGTMPELIREENYFFRLSRYTQRIYQKIDSGELEILPESRKHEILSFLSQGLEDVSFSRPRKGGWPAGLGVPVPNDTSHVMYVWCDALSNYITALGYGRDGQLFSEFWPANLHVIGKDILRFHAAIWPAMLMSAGLPLPRTLLVHGFITSEGKKMSKTLGNIIDPEEILEEYGTDAVRYFLSAHISPFEDSDITREGFKEIYNAYLANGLGNLVSRVMTMADAYLEGPVTPEPLKYPSVYAWEPLERSEINRSVEMIWEVIARIDQEISDTQPYKVIKDRPEEGREIVRGLVVQLDWVARMLAPFMPGTSEEIQRAIKDNKKPQNMFPRKE